MNEQGGGGKIYNLQTRTHHQHGVGESPIDNLAFESYTDPHTSMECLNPRLSLYLPIVHSSHCHLGRDIDCSAKRWKRVNWDASVLEPEV